MNKTLLVSGILVAGILIYPGDLLSQWRLVSGPGVTYVNCIFAKDSIVFAGTSYGVFSTTDNGNNWHMRNSGLMHNVECIVSENSNVYAGTNGYGIFLSTNNGLTWSSVNNGADVLGCRALASFRNQVFAGVYGGVYSSTNSGQQWTKSGLNSPDLLALFIDTTYSAGPIVLAGTGGSGVFRSTDYGITWTNVHGGWIFGFASCDTTIYTSDLDTVLVSKDHGITWTASSAGALFVTSFAAIGHTVFAGNSNGLYQSIGNTPWKYVSGTHNISSVFCHNNSTYAAGSTTGVLFSSDSGATWEIRNTGLVCEGIETLVLADTLLFAGTNQGGLFLSTDQGESWSTINRGLTNRIVLSVALSGMNYYAGTNDGVFLSTDRGLSWAPSYSLPAGDSVRSIAFRDTNLFVGTSQGIFFLTANDTSWMPRNNALLSTDVRTLIGLDSVLIAGTGSGVFVSFDEASTWLAADSGLGNFDIHCMACKGKNLFAGTSGGIFLSTNHGSYWSEVDSGLTDKDVRNIAVTPLSDTDFTIAVTTASMQFYLSSNNGASWRSDRSGGFDNHFGCLAFSDSTLIISGESGIWRCPTTAVLTSVENPIIDHPMTFRLMQNYPNPFNPSTTFSFSVPTRSYVLLTVFDMLGRQIAVIVSEVLAAGRYSRQWNATALPSGVYFYRLQAGTYTETKKLILLR